MTDGQSEWVRAAEAACDEPCRPSERDMMHVPKPPALCRTHSEELRAFYDVLHSLHGRVATLESRVANLEGKP
jgi:hypothetical protein